MSDPEELRHFFDKWRARWPGWPVAEAFIPEAQREVAMAWLALRSELADAAWSGSDPTPGAAKLGWWAEELFGWAQGARRHPLGMVLQKRPAPWEALASGIPALRSSRVQSGELAPAVKELEPFAEGLTRVSSALFEARPMASSWTTAIVLLGERALRQPPSGTPGELGARGLLLQPRYDGSSRPERIHAALVRARLQRLVAGKSPEPGRWRALLTAWRAARGQMPA